MMRNISNVTFDDNDFLFETESPDNAGKFIEVYTADDDVTRSFLRKDGKDPFIPVYGLYGETYQINFYTEYYPYTGEIAIHYCLDILTTDGADRVMDCDRQVDNVKDGYIVLTDEEKKTLRDKVVNYLGEEVIEEFTNLVENEIGI